jgi:hypothetical protein
VHRELALIWRSLDSRTIERITPRLQAFSDKFDRLATARAQQQQVDVSD